MLMNCVLGLWSEQFMSIFGEVEKLGSLMMSGGGQVGRSAAPNRPLQPLRSTRRRGSVVRSGQVKGWVGSPSGLFTPAAQAGLDGAAAQATKGRSGGADAEARCLAQKQAGAVVAQVGVGAGWREDRRRDVVALKLEVEAHDVVVGATQGLEHGRWRG